MNDIKSILIENHKAVFTVLSKNACTSMKAHIVKTLDIPQTVIYPRDVHSPHYDYPYITDDELITTYRSHLRFCIIRNPWSRLVSCYTNKIKNDDSGNSLYKNVVSNRYAHKNKKFKRGMSFEDFINIVCEFPDSEAEAHFRSQTYDMMTTTGKLRVNYIAKLENLHKHLEEINQLSGMTFDEFPKLNKTEKKIHYTEYYTPENIEKVRERYKADIHLFNYEFGEKSEFDLGKTDDMMGNKILKSPYFSQCLEEKDKAINLISQNLISKNSEKIFCIGLNKTGTRSLNTALNMLKSRAIHHDCDKGRVSHIFKYNIDNNKNILNNLQFYTAFSDWIDMEGTNNHFFKIMDQQYPNSKFIFTDRSLDSWIESRIKHVKKTDMLDQYQRHYPESNWYNMNTDAWKEEYKKHKQDVLTYFKHRKSDLLVFNVFKEDSWEKLCSFLNLPVPQDHFPFKGKTSYTKKTFIKKNLLKGNIFLKDRNTIFYFLPGCINLQVKASLISYVEGQNKFEFPNSTNLVNDFPFPTFEKDHSHPSFKNYFRFTIVRNPWDRLASLYKDMICSDDSLERYFEIGAEQSFNKHENLFYRNMPFDEFIEKICSLPESKSSSYFCSQIYQLANSNGELLVNYIGYYENVEKAALDIYEQSQISLHAIPLSKRRIKDISYTKLYSSELQDMVEKKYAGDISFFGYTFGITLEKQTVDFVSDQFTSLFTSSTFYKDILIEKNKTLNYQLAEKSKETNLFIDKLSRKETQLERLEMGQEIKNAKEELVALRNSTSWKITYPLRYFVSCLNKFSSDK